MKIRLALWGAGDVAKKFASAVVVNSNFILVGVASRTIKHAESVAHEFGIKAYSSYDELLHANDIDFVYVSTPTRFHYHDMKLLIAEGKNIICEKPFTETALEAKDIFTNADNHGVIIVDGLWSLYMPLFEYISQKSNEMGRLIFSSASLGWPSIKKEDNKITSKYEIWDYEIYPVSIMTSLFGNPTKIKSITKYSGNLISKSLALLKFQNGGWGRIHSSLKHRSSYIFLGVYTKGIIISRKWWLGDQNVYTLKYFFIPTIKRFAHKTNGYEYEIAEIQNRVINGKETKLPRDNTILILSVLDRIKNTV